MYIEIGAIIAISLAATATLSDALNIPKKMRSWAAMGLIILLNLANHAFLQAEPFVWQNAFTEGLMAGLAAVGIYSTGKNTRQHFLSSLTSQILDANTTPPNTPTQGTASETTGAEPAQTTQSTSPETENYKNNPKV
ncbi:hypothetical protein [Brevibacillus dissolubilis]|uniref:hypothetical protein n=1 Tax=Brevibacillus dissolubilis TaxID=1844116 RepID=UPI001117A92D|nr:hypothetical protein [Brevibacillus dissolubilis]